MAKCRVCGAPAEAYLDYSRTYLCSRCFNDYYERKVGATIQRFKMIKPNDRVLVAVSGGKDSASLLAVLRKLLPDVEMAALYINLGIPQYSDHCEEKFKKITEVLGVESLVFDLKRELGFSIPDFRRTVYRRRLCSPCGTIKRYLMNKIAVEQGFSKLATGHHMDDIVETLFNSYLHGDVEQIVRLKPVLSSTHPKFVAKIKPLWNVTEQENLFYATYNELPVRTVGCPLAKGARSLEQKRYLSSLVEHIPNFRHVFLSSHMRELLPALERSITAPPLKECKKCGMPTSGEVCAFCKRAELVLGKISNQSPKFKV